ncbi:MAG: endonuclease domain-containing protein [Acidaminococcus sp.]|jgi:very-short-patch-repair endonuclease|nr:endonuclease domain-containing protein [Acidaminococcus sp.]MCI2100547.1 endonuclease domain-containing protein [Acidaminococcus sp.]MCI2114868.1 endonuclease domain-containing protein [Acidaminococcus sp.]MCI2117551.1 endonuclease domain-containing protein [Acidaminococcus sp.]
MMRARDEVSYIEYDQLRYQARIMRKNMSVEEKTLWYQVLRKLPVHFTRKKVLYHFIADFYCAKAKLVVKVDGTEHFEKAVMAYDLRENAFLKSRGYEVIRFSELEIRNHLYTVKVKLRKVLEARLEGEFPKAASNGKS